VQALSYLADPADVQAEPGGGEGGGEEGGGRKRRGSPLVAVLVGYCDAWYREFDLVLGEMMLAALLCLSILPIAFLQARLRLRLRLRRRVRVRLSAAMPLHPTHRLPAG